jgi:hypothetical protein
MLSLKEAGRDVADDFNNQSVKAIGDWNVKVLADLVAIFDWGF